MPPRARLSSPTAGASEACVAHEPMAAVHASKCAKGVLGFPPAFAATVGASAQYGG
jgi:hypothetical protein